MPLSDITNTPSRKGSELSDFTRGMICGLSLHAEWTNTEIGKKLSVPRSTVATIVKNFVTEGFTSVKPRSGRPKKLQSRDERHLSLLIRREPFEPLGIHLQNLAASTRPISLATLRNAMKKHGFNSCKPAKKPFLSLRHRKLRKEWVENRLEWTIDDWKKVIWSDESRFALRHNDGGVRVIRKKGERYLNKFILPTFKFGKGSVMVWGCFWAGGLGPLVTLKGSVDQSKYINCLSQKFVPWLEKLKEEHGEDFIFQEDGASCHTGGYARWWKEKAGIKGFDYWPAQSPDLNPIEHIWRLLGQRLSKRRAQARNLDDLDVIIHEEWERLGIEVCHKLVSSMPARCQAVKKARGFNTSY